MTNNAQPREKATPTVSLRVRLHPEMVDRLKRDRAPSESWQGFMRRLLADKLRHTGPGGPAAQTIESDTCADCGLAGGFHFRVCPNHKGVPS